MSHRSTTAAAVAALPVATALALGGASPTAAAAIHAGHRSAVAATGSAVAAAMRGSTAHHVAYRFAVAGEGTISRAAGQRSAPASNEKLFTTVTLLQQVGAGFHYTTVVSYSGSFVGHTVDGDLILTGSGDPTLTRADLAQLGRKLHDQGVRRVTGRVVVDDGRYSKRTITHGWKRSFVPEETGTVDAFTVDRNTWRHGATFEHNPTPANAKVWKTVLTRHHIATHGKPLVASAPDTATPLVSHRSGPLREIVHKTLTDSDNFYAEMLLREAGAQQTGHGSLTSGIAAVRDEAGQLGVPLGKVYDGSGLSYADRESPTTLVQWLDAAATLTGYPTLRSSLPVSCRTGTLKHRLCGHGVAGRVHAKTGTLDHVNALSGWTTTASGHAVTFSVLLSGVRNPTTALDHLDAAVSKVARSH